MRKPLWMAACAFLAAVLPVNAATLTLRIKSGTVSEVFVYPGTAVPISITGVLSGEATDGLALWGVDVTRSAGALALNAPAGIMQGFKKNWGLTNPAGYGGTASGLTLLQVGGGQNTINYHGTTPAYPTGTVVEGVAAAEEALATGSLNTTGLAYGTDVTVTLANGFANTLNAGQAGPVYAVSPAAVVLGAPTLTVHVWSPPMHVWITGVNSVATHGAGNTPLKLSIGASTVEPRRVVVGGKAFAYIEVTFDQNMSAGAQPVTASPAIAGITATGNGTNVLTITLPSGVTDQTGYRINLAGATSVYGGVADATQNFCIRYLEGDVDRNGLVFASDKGAITSVANWNTAVVAATAALDLDRDGLIFAGDKGTVTSVANWNTTPSACP